MQMALTDHAHELLRSHFNNKDKSIAVDATCGNGFDTEFLLNLGFRKVYAFDIQADAIKTSRSRLPKNSDSHLEFHLTSHDTMDHYIDQKVDCIMFNFGYLPGGNKNLTTQADTTIRALNIALGLLDENGLISLMCYPGHQNGALETKAIEDWLSNLNKHYKFETHLAESPKQTAPILHLIKRRTSSTL